MAIGQEFGRDSSEARLAESHPTHPYYPLELVLPAYVPNESDLATIAGIFSMMLGCILSVTWALATRFRRGLSTGDKLVMLWFVLCKYQKKRARKENANAGQLAVYIHFSKVTSCSTALH